MTTHTQVHLTSSELGSLWTQYQHESLAICVLSHFKQNVDDPDIRELLKFALNYSQHNLSTLNSILIGSGYPLPTGFTINDLKPNAPRLFLDTYYLYYIKNMSRLGLAAYTLSLSLSARSDIRNYYQDCIITSMKVDKKVTDLMLSKGIYVRSPYIPPASEIEFANESSYLGSLWGKKRYLNAIEVSGLYTNLQTNIIGASMMTAFAQVAKSQAVRDYLLRGKELANKHINLFFTALKESELPASTPIDTLLTTSTESPFSDKLLLFHTTILLATGVGNYGLSMSTSQRMDLTIDYARLMAEIGLYAKDGAKLMIENKWLEEPPQAVNRKDLAMSKK